MFFARFHSLHQNIVFFLLICNPSTILSVTLEEHTQIQPSHAKFPVARPHIPYQSQPKKLKRWSWKSQTQPASQAHPEPAKITQTNANPELVQLSQPPTTKGFSPSNQVSQNYVFDDSAGQGVTIYIIDTGANTHSEVHSNIRRRDCVHTDRPARIGMDNTPRIQKMALHRTHRIRSPLERFPCAGIVHGRSWASGFR